MKGQLNAATPADYIAQLEGPRKTDIAALDSLIRKAAPNLKPFIMNGMLGYGRWHFKYASGREGDWSHIALANNQNYISLYFSVNGSLAERYKDELPKAKIGKCCVRFKRLADLDLGALTKMLQEAANQAEIL
jgi:hypothetical protein